MSLWWNIWSDDPVLIDGQTSTAVFPVSGGSGDVQPQSWQIEIPKVEFEETAPDNGFDDTETPPWLVVPANNPPNQNTVKVKIEPRSAASQIYFTVDDPGKATVSSNQVFAALQTLTLTGLTKGHTVLHARFGSASGHICTTVNICVRDKKVIVVDFHYMQDTVGHHTTRLMADVDALVSTMNSIWTPQANVVFQKGNVDNPTVGTNLGDVVEWYPTNPANEWDDIVTFRSDSTPDLFFVWEYDKMELLTPTILMLQNYMVIFYLRIRPESRLVKP